MKLLFVSLKVLLNQTLLNQSLSDNISFCLINMQLDELHTGPNIVPWIEHTVDKFEIPPSKVASVTMAPM